MIFIKDARFQETRTKKIIFLIHKYKMNLYLDPSGLDPYVLFLLSLKINLSWERLRDDLHRHDVRHHRGYHRHDGHRGAVIANVVSQLLEAAERREAGDRIGVGTGAFERHAGCEQSLDDEIVQVTRDAVPITEDCELLSVDSGDAEDTDEQA